MFYLRTHFLCKLYHLPLCPRTHPTFSTAHLVKVRFTMPKLRNRWELVHGWRGHFEDRKTLTVLS